jgi:serine protease
VLRVAATGPKGLRASYTNYGSDIDIAAPGGDNSNGIKGAILSTVKAGAGYRGSGFDFFQGTSMAAPHVTGLIALIHAINNNKKIVTNDDMKKILLNTTHDFGVSNNEDLSCYGKKSCGHGIIDSKNTLETFVADYDILFSSPSVDLLDLQTDTCSADKVIPKNLNLSLEEGTWELDQSTVVCQSRLMYTKPVLTFTDINNINVRHGAVVYHFSSNYSNCKQTGFDGIGCYFD